MINEILVIGTFALSTFNSPINSQLSSLEEAKELNNKLVLKSETNIQSLK